MIKKALSLTLLSCGSLHAAAITGLSLADNSSIPASDFVAGARYGEFSTNGTLGSITGSGSTLSFTSQMQFYNGYSVDSSAAAVGSTHSRRVDYTILFTIEDSLNQGYDLVLDSELLGYSTARYVSGSASNAIHVTGATMTGRIDTDLTDGVDTLGTSITGMQLSAASDITVDSTTAALANNFGSDSGSYAIGSFVGTRDFAIRYSMLTTPTTNIIMQNGSVGEGSLRYGMPNVDGKLDPTGQAQPDDAYDNSNLGHFVTVNATFTAVPEPSSTMLLGLGGLSLILRRKK